MYRPFSKMNEALTNFFSDLLSPLKSNFGFATALLPSTFFSALTWAFS